MRAVKEMILNEVTTVCSNPMWPVSLQELATKTGFKHGRPCKEKIVHLRRTSIRRMLRLSVFRTVSKFLMLSALYVAIQPCEASASHVPVAWILASACCYPWFTVWIICGQIIPTFCLIGRCHAPAKTQNNTLGLWGDMLCPSIYCAP